MEDYSKHGEGVCHMRCSGDNDIACGEPNSYNTFVGCRFGLLAVISIPIFNNSSSV